MSNKNNKLKWEDYDKNGELVLEAIRKNVNNTLYLESVLSTQSTQSGNEASNSIWELVENKNLDFTQPYLYSVFVIANDKNNGAVFTNNCFILTGHEKISKFTMNIPILGQKSVETSEPVLGYLRKIVKTKEFKVVDIFLREIKDAVITVLRQKIKLSIPD